MRIAARLVSDRKEDGVSLTVLGFGGLNYKDNRMEARRALIVEGGGTFNIRRNDLM